MKGGAPKGRLARRQGSGTFVSKPKIAQSLTMTSFSEDMRRRGLTPGARTLAMETLHVPAAAVAGLAADDLERFSFYELLADKFGVTLGEGLQTTEPTVLDEEEGRILRAPVHSPAFLFERVTRDTGGWPIEYVRSLYAGDRYQLVTELLPPRVRASWPDAR